MKHYSDISKQNSKRFSAFFQIISIAMLLLATSINGIQADGIQDARLGKALTATLYNFDITNGVGIASVSSTNPSGQYASGQGITITCEAAEGYTFAGWYDQAGRVFANQTHYFLMPENDLILEARAFIGAPFVLTLGKDEGISLVGGAGSYPLGTWVTISCTPATGYMFDGWYNTETGGTPIFSTVSATIPMSNNITLYARSTALTHNLTLSGTTGITLDSKDSTYNANDIISVTCTVNSGYVFTGWFDKLNNTLVSTSLQYTFNMPVFDYSLEARATLATAKLIVSNDDGIASTSQTGEKTYFINTQVSLSCTVKPGYSFAGWWNTTTDEEVFSNTSCIVTIPISGIAFEARTRPLNPYHNFTILAGDDRITYMVPTSGTIELKTANQLVTVEALSFAEGYEFGGWYTVKVINGERMIGLKSTANPYTFPMPDNDETLEAHAKASRYKVTITKGAGITSATIVNPTANGYYPTDTTITCIAEMAAGYLFNGWYSPNSVTIANTSTYTFTMPAKEVSYEARAIIKTYTVTFNYNYPDAPPPSIHIAEYMQPVAIPDTPFRTGYSFAGWYVNKEGGIPWSIYLPILKNTTVYAKWIADTNADDPILSGALAVNPLPEGDSSIFDPALFTVYYDLKGQRVLLPQSGRFYIIHNPITGQRRKIIYP